MILACVAATSGCSDDDEFQLTEEQLVRKDWFYNGSRDQWSYNTDDVVEVLYFNSNHDVVEKEFAGRQEERRGTWSMGENTIDLQWSGNEQETWTVLDGSKSFLKVQGWGTREYRTDENLEQLTGDAYWVNEFLGSAGTDGFTTRLAFVLEGNNHIRDAHALLSDNEEGRIRLEKTGTTAWSGKVEWPNEAVRVRFSCRIGSSDYMKFDDEVSTRNFSSLRWEDINVKPTLTSNGVRVGWNLINGNNCYYQVSIFAEGDEDEPYFVSQLLEGNNLDITMTTTGVVNRLNELKYGTPCKARLAVIMLEDGVPHNDVYATNNLQAVLYATSSGTFSPEF